MPYYFELITTNGMYLEPDRTPAGQDWYDDLMPHQKDGPITEWMRPYYPSVALLDDRSQLFHWGWTAYTFVVSQLAKQCIEQCEPAFHQFTEIALRHKGVSHRYWLLKFGNSIASVDVEKSRLNWRFSADGTAKYWIKKPSVPLCIKRNAVSGAHLWMDQDDSMLKFMSDELHSVLAVQNALTGIACEKQDDC